MNFKHGYLFLSFVSAILSAPFGHAACVLDDIDFTSTPEGCEDLATGLVWSSDILPIVGADFIGIHFTNSNYFCSQVFSGQVDTDSDGQEEVYSEAGGFTDWRAPTVREVLTALENGLATHLDYSFDSGNQFADATPRWTQCTAKLKGLLGGFTVDHTTSSLSWQQTIPGSFNEDLLCVRGAPANLDNDCPNSKGDLPSEDGGKGGDKGNGKGKNAMLPRAGMGTLLIMPALIMGSLGYFTRRVDHAC